MESESSTSCEEVYLNEQEIVDLVKNKILEGKSITIGFMERFYTDSKIKLNEIKNNNPEINILLAPLLINEDMLGEIIFKRNPNGEITANINAMSAFYDKKDIIISINIPIVLFNKFCDLMINVGIFSVDEILLTSI